MLIFQSLMPLFNFSTVENEITQVKLFVFLLFFIKYARFFASQGQEFYVRILYTKTETEESIAYVLRKTGSDEGTT